MTRLAEGIATLDREIVRIKRGVKRTQFNIRHTEKYGGKLEREAASYKGRMERLPKRTQQHLGKTRGSAAKSPICG